MKSKCVLSGVALLLLAAAGCGSDYSKLDVTQNALTDPGALVAMDMDSQVGVLLDELPPGSVRELAATNAAAQPTSFWQDRAVRQARLMGYRLVFRAQYYNSAFSNTGNIHGALPMPPPSTWTATITSAPFRTQIGNHDLVMVNYHFSATILTDSSSPGISEQSLGTIGGTWNENFTLPSDPELLFERTGYSCMDEDEFPPHSVFEYNVNYFYDDSCNSSPGSTCHVSVNNVNSCNAELGQMVGRVNTALLFTRIPWDSRRASAVRVGTVNPNAVNPPAPDLAVVGDGLVDEHAFRWQFFTANDCDLGEGVIGALGWRRVLMFSAILQNNGMGDLNVGGPTDPTNPFVMANDFEFSQCHQHYHFSHYGTFNYAGLPGAKRAFCLEDTNRYHNDETTPLNNVHPTCNLQGISRGWGDEYNWGIPGQWIDVTGYSNKKAQTLSFSANPDQFLCEGSYALDASGHNTFTPTSFINPQNGQPEQRINCNFLSGWNTNNVGSTTVDPGQGSFVTDSCKHGEIGPIRDCGFAQHASFLHACTSGQTVTLTCNATSSALQVLRLCEKSAQQGTGVACVGSASIANAVIGPTPTQVTFTCPAVRDAVMVADANGILEPQTAAGVGGYSVYQAPIGTLSSTDSGAQPAINCIGW
jgi:hypothetical protein